MKIFIAGATGVLGRRLIGQFRARNHSVIGLVRSSQGEQIVQSFGGESRWGDLFDTDTLARAAEGANVVIQAATSIPNKRRLAPSDFEMNNRIRRDGTRALTTCAAKIGAQLYLQQSIVWVVQPSDGSAFNEDSPTSPNPVTLSAVEGEAIAREAGERFGFNVSVLRCGWFYSADSSHTRIMGEELFRRRMPIIGKGNAIKSLLHIDDAASAFITAAETNQGGLWHIVDDYPVTMAELLTGFAARLGAPPPRHVPAWLARLVAGRYLVSFLTSSIRTSNARFRREFGWAPRFPSFNEGLDQVITAWKSEGFLKKNKWT
jgi:nucleoside-diphosphate-sugar epimerase